LAAAQAAQTEALTELAIAQTKVLRLSSTDMDIVAEDDTAPGVGSGSTAPKEHTAPGVGSGSTASMDIVEEDHTGHGAGSASRDTQCGLFTGASGESQKPLLKGHCKFCGRAFEHPSMVAYFLPEEGRPFAKVAEPVVQKVLQKTVVNIFDDREVYPGCAFCAETWHKREHAYVNEIVKDGRTSFKLTSEWTRLKDKSRGKGLISIMPS
jgi:hypothetical protein